MAEPVWTKTAFQTYDPSANIVFVTFPRAHLETQEEIRHHFDTIVEFWQSNCRGRKVYYVVDYGQFSINLRENDFYAEQMRRVLEQCTITVVRYGGDPLQRTAARLVNMKLHSPSNLYESREQALEVVRALKAGTMQIAPGPRP